MKPDSKESKARRDLDTPISELLARWNEEGPEVAGDVAEQLIDELKQIAAGFLRRERRDHTLQPTALVNELYMRLLERKRVSWNDRSHFLSFAARTVRRILVDHARRRGAEKRHGGREQTTLDSALLLGQPRKIEILDLEKALCLLEEEDPRLAKVIELHYFAGFTVQEIVEALRISSATVKRDLRAARAFLLHRLKHQEDRV